MVVRMENIFVGSIKEYLQKSGLSEKNFHKMVNDGRLKRESLSRYESVISTSNISDDFIKTYGWVEHPPFYGSTQSYCRAY